MPTAQASELNKLAGNSISSPVAGSLLAVVLAGREFLNVSEVSNDWTLTRTLTLTLTVFMQHGPGFPNAVKPQHRPPTLAGVRFRASSSTLRSSKAPGEVLDRWNSDANLATIRVGSLKVGSSRTKYDSLKDPAASQTLKPLETPKPKAQVQAKGHAHKVAKPMKVKTQGKKKGKPAARQTRLTSLFKVKSKGGH